MNQSSIESQQQEREAIVTTVEQSMEPVEDADDGEMCDQPEKTCCNDCRNKSKVLRKVQKDNSYLRRRVRQLKETKLVSNIFKIT